MMFNTWSMLFDLCLLRFDRWPMFEKCLVMFNT